MRVAALTLVLAISAGCAGPEPTGTPADASAVIRPDLMVPTQARVTAGLPVNLTFPKHTDRGVAFVLEQRAGATWASRYLLISNMAGEGSWHLPDAEVSWGDIGIGGFGPDRVPIPEIATPGLYRICTLNAVDNFCAPIEVLAP